MSDQGKVRKFSYRIDVHPLEGMNILLRHDQMGEHLWTMSIPGWLELRHYVNGSWETRTCSRTEFLCRFIGKQEENWNVNLLRSDPETNKFLHSFLHAERRGIRALSEEAAISPENGARLASAALALEDPHEYIDACGKVPQADFEAVLLPKMSGGAQDHYRKRRVEP